MINTDLTIPTEGKGETGVLVNDKMFLFLIRQEVTFDILKSGNIGVHMSAHLLVLCVISWIIVSLFISHCYVLFSFDLRLLITLGVTSNILQLSGIVYRALVSATSGTGTDCSSRVPEFTRGFKWGRATRSLLLCVCFVDQYLSFVLFLLIIVMYILLRYIDSNYPFGIFKFFFQSL